MLRLLVLFTLLLSMDGMAQTYTVPSHALHLRGVVTPDNASALAGALGSLSDTLVIDSLGGDYDAAVSLSKTLVKLRQNGKGVTCVSQGQIGSSAYYILLHCARVVLTRQTIIFMHEIGVSTGSTPFTPQQLRQLASEVDREQRKWDLIGSRTLGIPLDKYVGLKLQYISADKLVGMSTRKWATLVDSLEFAGIPLPAEAEVEE